MFVFGFADVHPDTKSHSLHLCYKSLRTIATYTHTFMLSHTELILAVQIKHKLILKLLLE